MVKMEKAKDAPEQTSPEKMPGKAPAPARAKRTVSKTSKKLLTAASELVKIATGVTASAAKPVLKRGKRAVKEIKEAVVLGSKAVAQAVTPAPAAATPSGRVLSTIAVTPVEPPSRGPAETQQNHKEKTSTRRVSHPARAVLPPDFPYKVPSILLEGDEPAPLPKSKALPKSAQTAIQDLLLEKVFARYGTTLHLAAREPRSLYASWDLTLEEQRTFNARSADHHLVLRARREKLDGPIAAEAHVHPESQHWFLHVDAEGAAYVAELGYYAQDSHWVSLAASEVVSTPPDKPVDVAIPAEQFVRVTSASLPTPATTSPAESGAAGRVTTPGDGKTEAAPATAGPGDSSAFIEAPSPPPSADSRPSAGWVTSPAEPARSTATIGRSSPAPQRIRIEPAPAPPLSGQEDVVLDTALETVWHREHTSSAEMAEYFQKIWEFLRAGRQEGQLQELPSSAAPAFETAPPGDVSSITLAEAPTPGSALVTPVGAPQKFWFHVNAELVIYGATEPDATVTIGDRAIRLRPDGSFSYRFALPDGEFKLPVVAVAAHGDQRGVQLRFARGTTRSGDVGTHSQDKSLKPPAPENIS